MPMRDDIAEGLRFAGELAWSTPRRRAIVGGVAGLAVLGALVGGVLAWRAAQVPDFETADLDLALDFAFLEPEFNDLPVQERAELIGELVSRFGDMGSSDSVMLAAFAAGVQGAARDQLAENASQLMIDLVDQHAEDYRDVPPAERVAYIEDRVVELARTFRLMAGMDATASDDELLDRARRDAKREQEYLREGRQSPEQVGRMFTFMHESVGPHASAHQRARLGLFVRDMTRVLRGEPLD